MHLNFSFESRRCCFELLLLCVAAVCTASVAAVAAADSSYRQQQRRPPQQQQQSFVLRELTLSLVADNASDINHRFWFQRLFRTALYAQEAACLQNGTVYYAPTRSCHPLYLQGPCNATQWLVMEGFADGRGLRATCARRPCAPHFEFLTEGGGQRLCVPEADACAHKRDAPNRTFKYSLDGEGRCGCKGYRLLGPDDRCHVFFEQGPCSPGQMLAPRYDASLETMSSVCVPKSCNASDGGRAYTVVLENGTVYQECVSVDALKCSPTFDPLFSSWVDLSVPLCVDLNRAAIGISSRPSGCVVVGGRCSANVVVRSALPYDWGVEDDLFRERSAASATASSPADVAASKASPSPRLRRHLTLSALYDALFR